MIYADENFGGAQNLNFPQYSQGNFPNDKNIMHTISKRFLENWLSNAPIIHFYCLFILNN